MRDETVNEKGEAILQNQLSRAKNRRRLPRIFSDTGKISLRRRAHTILAGGSFSSARNSTKQTQAHGKCPSSPRGCCEHVEILFIEARNHRLRGTLKGRNRVEWITWVGLFRKCCFPFARQRESLSGWEEVTYQNFITTSSAIREEKHSIARSENTLKYLHDIRFTLALSTPCLPTFRGLLCIFSTRIIYVYIEEKSNNAWAERVMVEIDKPAHCGYLQHNNHDNKSSRLRHIARHGNYERSVPFMLHAFHSIMVIQYLNKKIEMHFLIADSLTWMEIVCSRNWNLHFDEIFLCEWESFDIKLFWSWSCFPKLKIPFQYKKRYKDRHKVFIPFSIPIEFAKLA